MSVIDKFIWMDSIENDFVFLLVTGDALIKN